MEEGGAVFVTAPNSFRRKVCHLSEHCAGPAWVARPLRPRRSGADRLLLVVGMAADDFLGPDELFARCKDLAHGGDDDPRGEACGDEGIGDRITGQADQEAGTYRPQGYVDVADIVNIGEADRGVVAARRE